MTHLFITPQNIAQHPWLWNFLEEQRQANIDQWDTTQTYSYGENTFQFAQPVFARLRKENRGYAYEMESKDLLGKGSCGEVYRIICTISLGKIGQFQVTDKKRLVKIQEHGRAVYEYERAQRVKHLHVKQPAHGRMVMKEIKGRALDSLIEENPLSQQDTLELTKKLLHAYKTQVADNNLSHKDFHSGNILVQYDPKKVNPFKVKIIDFGCSVYPHRLESFQLRDIILFLWAKQPNYEFIKTCLDTYDFPAIEACIKVFDELILPPDNIQKPFNLLLTYINSHYSSKLGLQKTILDGFKQTSSINHCDPLKTAILNCKQTLDRRQLDKDNTFLPVFDFNYDSKRQQLIDKIFINFSQLSAKGKKLEKLGKKEDGEQLCALSEILKNKTLVAIHQPRAQQALALIECQNECKKLFNTHKNLLNIHRNSNYIWAEVGIILSSLIILYPLVAGINYLVTGQIGFFSQTHTAEKAQQIENDFHTLISCRG